MLDNDACYTTHRNSTKRTQLTLLPVLRPSPGPVWAPSGPVLRSPTGPAAHAVPTGAPATAAEGQGRRRRQLSHGLSRRSLLLLCLRRDLRMLVRLFICSCPLHSCRAAILCRAHRWRKLSAGPVLRCAGAPRSPQQRYASHAIPRRLLLTPL